MARLSRSRVFSVIDAAAAFHAVSVAEEDRHLTAFSSPFGQYEWLRLPFGLSGAPHTYSRLSNELVQGLPDPTVALPYLVREIRLQRRTVHQVIRGVSLLQDDIIIHSKNLDEHLRHLAMVLLAHRQAGVRLEPAKCQLFRYVPLKSKKKQI